MARRFNTSQRIKMFIASDGKCAKCGLDLQEDWEADHVVPYSKGGKTQSDNGQALCPVCNRRKGNKMNINNQVSYDSLRQWQKLFLQKFTRWTEPNFLLVATPGAGKTFASLTAAHEYMFAEKIDLIVIVCPSKNLKYQWADDANKFGINLNPDFDSGKVVVAEDCHGICVTYQQVALSSAAFARLCMDYKVFVIFDEMHHSGEQLTWGVSVKLAFSGAIKRLSLSGTPFRTDNSAIPFIQYDREGKSVADFMYDYGSAIADGVCRPVFFPSYEGQIDWYSSDGEIISANFRDVLSQKKAAERLRMAVDISSGWLTNVLEDANQKIIAFRRSGHPDAAGLVIAKDVREAQAIYDYIHKCVSKDVVLVTSEDEDAAKKIKRFKDSKDSWIVAVRMVSEGVDIRRLRVCVYATNYSTELFFRQAVGRIVRNIGLVDDESGEVAYFYIPRDSKLLEYAQKIKEERNHQLIDNGLHDILKSTPERDEIRDRIFGYPIPIFGESRADDVILPDDAIPYTQDELAKAEIIKSQVGLPSGYDVVMLAKIVRIARGTDNHPEQSTSDKKVTGVGQREKLPQYEQKEQLRSLIRRLVSQYHTAIYGNLDYKDINYRLMREQGGISVKEATLDQLVARVEILKKWIGEARNGEPFA